MSGAPPPPGDGGAHGKCTTPACLNGESDAGRKSKFAGSTRRNSATPPGCVRMPFQNAVLFCPGGSPRGPFVDGPTDTVATLKYSEWVLDPFVSQPLRPSTLLVGITNPAPWPSNTMTPSAERTSAEIQSSRRPQREVAPEGGR